jgi:chorismate-pyruvate lyase
MATVALGPGFGQAAGMRVSMLALAACLVVTGSAGAAYGPQQRAADRARRQEALAMLRDLNARLLANSSATLALESWCGEHRLAPHPVIVAERVRDIFKPAGAEQRRRLAVGPDEPIRYRRVRLRCGDVVLSEADNWYVPARLTPEMNRLLDETDTPFGKAVRDLRPTRTTIAVKHFWHGGVIRDPVLQHRAVLIGADGRAISEVYENYTAAALGLGRD